jgi:hypothetical protein
MWLLIDAVVWCRSAYLPPSEFSYVFIGMKSVCICRLDTNELRFVFVDKHLSDEFLDGEIFDTMLKAKVLTERSRSTGRSLFQKPWTCGLHQRDDPRFLWWYRKICGQRVNLNDQKSGMEVRIEILRSRFRVDWVLTTQEERTKSIAQHMVE